MSSTRETSAPTPAARAAGTGQHPLAALRARLVSQRGTSPLVGSIVVTLMAVAVVVPVNAQVVPGVKQALVDVIRLLDPDRQRESGADVKAKPRVQLAMGAVVKGLGRWLMRRLRRRKARPSDAEVRRLREAARQEITRVSEQLVQLRRALRGNQAMLDETPNMLDWQRTLILERMQRARAEIQMLETRLLSLLNSLPPP